MNSQVSSNKIKASMNMRRSSKTGQTPSAGGNETGQTQGTLLKKVAVAYGASAANFPGGEGDRASIEAYKQVSNVTDAASPPKIDFMKKYR